MPEDAPIWGQVQSSSETRIGQRCGHYERCFVTKMRRAAEEAQIIVVNHHLFFADLALRDAPQGGGALPDYDAVIFDEAHQIEDVVTEFFGVRLSTARIEALVRDAERAFRAAKMLDAQEGSGTRRAHCGQPVLQRLAARARERDRPPNPARALAARAKRAKTCSASMPRSKRSKAMPSCRRR